MHSYPWPGNIRELRHVLERAVLLNTQASIGLESLRLNDPLLGDSENSRGGGDGGDRFPPDLDPIIAGLLQRLPKSGSVWPEAERKRWLDLLSGCFWLIYKSDNNVSEPE